MTWPALSESLPQMATPEELAELYPVSAQTIRRKVKAGELAGVKFGRRWLVNVTKFREWLEGDSVTSYIDSYRTHESRDDEWGHHPTLWTHTVCCTTCGREDSFPYLQHAVDHAESHEASHNGGILEVDREALALYDQGFTYAEIMRQTGCSLGMALARVKRAQFESDRDRKAAEVAAKALQEVAW